MPLTPWDFLLILGVSLQATSVAYLRSPRWKALALTIPVPFTLIALSVGRPIDATNVFALVLLFVYAQSVRILHQRLRISIIPAIVLAVLIYIALGWALADVFPRTEAAFWLVSAGIFAFGLLLHLTMPHRSEPAHRTPLPVWKKLPIIMSVVVLLIAIKTSLQGFATLFPLVSVIGAYEARHSLWMVGRQVPVLMLTLIPMLIVSRLMQGQVGLGPSLALGWIVFLITLILITRAMWTQWPQTLEPVEPSA